MDKEITLQEALAELDKAYGDTIKTMNELHQKKVALIIKYKQQEDEAKLRAARENLQSWF